MTRQAAATTRPTGPEATTSESAARQSSPTHRSWSFLAEPKWIVSHVFVLSLLAVFVYAGFWQLDRRAERQTINAVITDRAEEDPVSVAEAASLVSGNVDTAIAGEILDYVAISDEGRFVDPEAVRVANRSQNGVAGDWVIAVAETGDGQLVLVNRGFLPRDIEAAPPLQSGPGGAELTGWLRRSQTRDGVFGATDTGEGERAPRLDIDAIAERLDLEGELVPAWLQLDEQAVAGSDDPALPIPVPLPAVDDGPHLSYAVQWFLFASMSIVVYSLVLRRRARAVPAPERAEGNLLE